MTPQEASEELKEEFEIFKNGISPTDWENPNEELKKIIEANTMAIEVLGQMPCEDCVSREAVNVLIDELARAISDERCFVSRGRATSTIMQDILELPSVTPKYTDEEIDRAQAVEQAYIDKMVELTVEEWCKNGRK